MLSAKLAIADEPSPAHLLAALAIVRGRRIVSLRLRSFEGICCAHAVDKIEPQIFLRSKFD